MSNNNITITGKAIPIWVNKNTDIVSKTQLTWSDNITADYNSPKWIELKLVDDNNNLIGVDGGINVTIENTNTTMEFDRDYKKYSGSFTPDFFGVRLINSTVFSNVTSSVYVIVKEYSTLNITSDVNKFNVSITVTMNIENCKVNITFNKETHEVNVTNYVGKIDFGNLKPATYTVKGEFLENENYNGVESTAEFEIFKQNVTSSIGYSPQNGFNINVTVEFVGVDGVPVTGNVTFDSNKTPKYNNAVVNGTAIFNLADLDAGNYPFELVFSGNDYYNGTTVAGGFVIVKQNATVSVSVDNGTYGEHVKVNVTLIGVNGIPLNGNVTIINGTKHNESVADGKGSFDYDVILTAGKHNVTVKFEGDESYNVTENSTTFNIAKLDTTVSVVVNNVACMENITGTVTLNDVNGVKLNGTVNITINGTQYPSINVVNGNGTINLTNNLTSGEYNVTVTYAETQNYTAATGNTTFIVEKITTTIECNIGVNGSNATIKVTTNANGTVNITVDGITEEVTIVNGSVVLTVSDLTDGNHNVTVTYPGNEYYNGTKVNDTFSVGKLASNMAIEAVPGVFNATITVTLNTNGTVKITIDGRNFTVEVNNTVNSIVVSDLKPGNYAIVGVFEGNDHYDGTTATGSVTIAKSVPVVDVKVNTTGSNATIMVFTDANGTVNITVDGTSYNRTIVNGSVVLTVSDLTDGNHNVTVTYPGNEYYNGTKVNDTFSVGKLASNMAIEAVPGVFNATITVTLNTDGKVKITIDNRNFPVIIKGGIGSVVVSNLKPAKYNINAVFDGNDHYDGTTANGSVIIAKQVPVVDVKVNVTGSNAAIMVITDANGAVNIAVDGITEEVPINNGSAVLTVSDLTDGKHNVTVTYPSNDYFNEFTTSEVFEVESKSLIITAEPVIEFLGGNETLVIKATDVEGNPVAGIFVEFEINGIKYNRTTDSKGLAVKPIDLPVGFYKFDVCFKGNLDYGPITVSSNITVKTTIVSKDFTKIFRNGTQYVAVFLDSKGRPIVGVKVSLNINGVFYDKITEKDGSVVLDINLLPDTYVLTAFNPVTGEEAAVSITVLPNMIAENVTKYYMNDTQFYMTLLGDDGNPAPIGTNVVFNINGVFYEKTTIDGSGGVKLDINLLPDTYILTAEYKGLQRSYIVEVLPTIVTSDVSMQVSDRKQFTGKILNKDGSPAAGANVTMNIHGVFYNKITGLDGSFSLDINLAPGEYIITSYCDDTARSNMITVKE